MIVTLFHHADEHRHAQAKHKGERQFERIVRMKLEFRQQIAARDAEEGAGAKSQRTPEEDGIRLGKVGRPQMKKQYSERCGHRKQDV